jgi:hypothetical protein
VSRAARASRPIRVEIGEVSRRFGEEGALRRGRASVTDSPWRTNAAQ